MINKKLIISLMVLLLLTGAGFSSWWFFLRGDSMVTLREDLPPAPAGYKTLQEDVAIVAELPEATKQQYREGFADILKTIEEHPDSFVAWFNLGSIKSYMGDYKGAEEAWVYAIAISPNQGRAYMNLGDLYTNKIHDYQKAEEAYVNVLEVEGGQLERTRAYRELASLYRFSYTQKKDQALHILRRGIETEEDSAELLALAGMWAWQDGLLREAEQFYTQYLVKNPNQEQAQKDLAQIRREMGQ